jgi:hypothetical protein
MISAKPGDWARTIIDEDQAFWQEITGDPDFYLKLIRLMKDVPPETSRNTNPFGMEP